MNKRLNTNSAKTILVVEDRISTIQFNLLLLKERGYDILLKTRYKDAFEYIDTCQHYDLALIDHQIGDSDGFNGGNTLIELSKEKNPKANIVCISAYCDQSSSANANWNKLDDPDTLVELVERLLDTV